MNMNVKKKNEFANKFLDVVNEAHEKEVALGTAPVANSTPAATTAPVYSSVQSSDTIISKGMTFEGNLKSNETVRIIVHGAVNGDLLTKGDISCYGEITGNVDCANLTMTGGKILGNIICSEDVVVDNVSDVEGNVTSDSLDCSGIIKGDGKVKNTVSLKSGSMFVGDITCGLLSVQEGAVINGKLNIQQASTTPATPVAPMVTPVITPVAPKEKAEN